MFLESLKSRIEEYKDLVSYYNSIDKTQAQTCSGELNMALRSIIVSLTLMMIVYIILVALSFYFLIRIAVEKHAPIYLVFVLFILMFLPHYGGIVMVFVVLYGMIAFKGVSIGDKNVPDMFADWKRSRTK